MDETVLVCIITSTQINMDEIEIILIRYRAFIFNLINPLIQIWSISLQIKINLLLLFSFACNGSKFILVLSLKK